MYINVLGNKFSIRTRRFSEQKDKKSTSRIHEKTGDEPEIGLRVDEQGGRIAKLFVVI